MFGVLYPEQGRGKVEQRDILGLPVLWVTVPTGGLCEKHRVARAERLLRRHGVRYLLPMREKPKWQVSLPVVDPLPLYRALADRLVLELLKIRGIEAYRAVVTLAGERLDGDLVRTAHLLCPRVRTLLLEVGGGGERLTMDLYRKYGVAVYAGGQADLCVRFSGESHPGELVLCRKPELLEISVEVPELRLPESLEPMPLVTALWQVGRIGVKDFCLRQKKEDLVAKTDKI